MKRENVMLRKLCRQMYEKGAKDETQGRKQKNVLTLWGESGGGGRRASCPVLLGAEETLWKEDAQVEVVEVVEVDHAYKTRVLQNCTTHDNTADDVPLVKVVSTGSSYCKPVMHLH